MRALLLGISIAASGAASAGVVMEVTVRDLVDSTIAPVVEQLWIDGGRLRMDESDTSMIFKERTIYTLDHGARKYIAMDKATMDGFAARAAEMNRQWESQMADLPAEERARMKEMIGGTSRSQVRNTGRSDTVEGRACRVWIIEEDGVMSQELCVVAPGSLPGGNDVIKAMREMSDMSRGLVDEGSDDESMGFWSEFFDKVGGIPIRTRDFEDGKAVEESRLTAVREQSIAAATFDVPAGYRKQQLDSFGGTPDE